MTKKKMNKAMKDPSGRVTAAGRAYFKEGPKTKPKARAVTKRKASPVKQGESSKISIFYQALASVKKLADRGRKMLDRSKRSQLRTKEA